MLLIALGIAIAVAIGWWLNQGDDPRSDAAARLADGSRHGRASHDSIGFGSSDSDSDPRSASAGGARRLVADGGMPPPPSPLPRSGRTAPPIVDMPGNAQDSEHSAGWRLGQTRHNLEIIQPRIAHMEQLVQDFEARGDTAAAEQQRRILERFQNRLTELRQDETELEAQARQDDSLGDVQTGYDEGADERERPPARVTPTGGSGTPGHESAVAPAQGQ